METIACQVRYADNRDRECGIMVGWSHQNSTIWISVYSLLDGARITLSWDTSTRILSFDLDFYTLQFSLVNVWVFLFSKMLLVCNSVFFWLLQPCVHFVYSEASSPSQLANCINILILSKPLRCCRTALKYMFIVTVWTVNTFAARYIIQSLFACRSALTFADQPYIRIVPALTLFQSCLEWQVEQHHPAAVRAIHAQQAKFSIYGTGWWTIRLRGW